MSKEVATLTQLMDSMRNYLQYVCCSHAPHISNIDVSIFIKIIGMQWKYQSDFWPLLRAPMSRDTLMNQPSTMEQMGYTPSHYFTRKNKKEQ
jgi:hypothetical protein